MQCLPQIQHHRGMMGNAVIDAVLNSRSLNENIIAVIVAKYSVRNAQARLVLCPNSALKKRFAILNFKHILETAFR